MLYQESQLRRRIDQLEREGRYIDMVSPLEELVNLLSFCCSGGGCSATKEQPEYAAALDRLAGLHRNLGNLERSLDLYTQALRTSATVFGTADPNYATTLNNYAGLQRLRGDTAAAREAYLRAEAIYTDTIGANHVLTVSALNNRGLLCQDEGLLDEARALHTEALTRLRKETGNDVAIATTLNNLASLAAKEQKYDEATRYMEEASEIYQRTVGEQSDLYLGQIHNLASLQALSGDFAGALERYEWVLQRCREMFGPRSENLAKVLRNIVSVATQLGNSERARIAQAELDAIVGNAARKDS